MKLTEIMKTPFVHFIKKVIKTFAIKTTIYDDFFYQYSIVRPKNE